MDVSCALFPTIFFTLLNVWLSSIHYLVFFCILETEKTNFWSPVIVFFCAVSLSILCIIMINIYWLHWYTQYVVITLCATIHLLLTFVVENIIFSNFYHFLKSLEEKKLSKSKQVNYLTMDKQAFSARKSTYLLR